MKTSTTGLRFPRARAFRWELPIAVLVSFLSAVIATAQTYEIVHAFRNSGQPSDLIRGTDGSLYGVTGWGGTHGAGSIFRIDSSNRLETLYSFAPRACGGEPDRLTLMQAADGNLYGTTSRGDTNVGTVFKMDSSGTFVTLHSFSGPDGVWPYGRLIQGSDGNLYGTTVQGGPNYSTGTVFRMDLLGNITTLHAFISPEDGFVLYGGLLQASDGNLYGMTYQGGASNVGTVFKMDLAGNLTVLHSFSGADGANPYQVSLIQATDGRLFGTTSAGGTNNVGTAFQIDSAGSFSTIHNFSTSEGSYPLTLMQATDGDLYGMTSRGGSSNLGAAFRMSLDGTVTSLHSFQGSEGSYPTSALVPGSDSTLNGITQFGGSGGVGVVFEMESSGTVSTLVSFQNIEAGLGIGSRFLQASDGSLYATSGGSIFRMDLSGNLTLLHTFASEEGSGPYSALIQGTDGAFYGTATSGGAHGFGTVFKMEPAGAVTTLHSFDVNGADGYSPEAALLQASDGNLYGTTLGGGDHNAGTVFTMDPSGNFSTLHSFDDVNGSNPMASLIQASDGLLYGTTFNGGEGFLGTVFALSPSGDFAIRHSFDSIEEANPLAGLLQGSDGNLYGTTSYVDGTIFKIDLLGSFSTVHYFRMFDENDGDVPYDGLVEASDGNYYGTTFRGGTPTGQYPQAGTVFRMEPSGNVIVVHSFDCLDGGSPTVSVIQASDGNLYGTAGGGPFRAGVIFRLSNATVALNQVTPNSGPASGGTTLDLLGGAFSQDAAVLVGGVPGTSVTVLDPTFLYLSTPALTPGTLNDVTVTNPGSVPATATKAKAFFADFLDVPQTYLFHDYVEKIFRAGITAGCSGGSYCPDDAVTRAQMAVFLLKAEHGSGYAPPPCSGHFADVTCPSQFANWIEQLAAEGITAGCGGGNYCPNDAVTRAQMAVFLLKVEHGPGYAPPPCTGLFGDVECPSLFGNFIEQLAAEGITGGCGGGNYCPNDPNTRGQMAVFLVKTFHL